MRYDGALAVQLDGTAYETFETSRITRRPSLTTHEGGGLDASARVGVSSSFVSTVSVVVALIVVLCAIGMARIALTAGTVQILQNNEALSSQIKDVRALNNDLQIECSLFSGSDRIGRIATQNLGMERANEVEFISMN